MSISVLLFFMLSGADQKNLLAVSVPVWFAILIIIFFEKQMPFSKLWKPTLNDLKNDAVYLILIQTLLPQLLVWLTTLFFIQFIKTQNLIITHIWPHHWPIGIQEITLILISDFLRYWLHRFNHTIPFLWRFHAVHHSVQKMYWMNTSRFHPVEKSLQFLMDVFPFLLLGVSEKVIALHLVLYGVNGFFQHSNINLKFGWLNYLVSSPELHRWHHSRKIEESNNNYGNNVIIWDILFGSFFLPKDKVITELGLQNKNYPMGFQKQMKTPLINKYDKVELPEISLWHLFLNAFLKLRLFRIKIKVQLPFLNATKTCDVVQKEVLMKIISANKETEFGKEHGFEKIVSYNDYKKSVPIQNYETLKPYIQKQAENASVKALIAEDIKMFNKTSGTTSTPKLIPVTNEILKGLKMSQDLMVYNQYLVQPFSYFGKIVGIASPAIESMSTYNIPIGSASGQFYKNVSKMVESKYVIPYEVLEISDYELKYYVILLFCLQHKDITYIATANPTTIIKLIEILNAKKTELLNDLKSGTISGISPNADSNYIKILKKFNPKIERVIELEILFNTNSYISFKEICPYLKLISTWTGGSCGIALNSVIPLLPKDVSIIDLGYLSSEIRASITFDQKNQAGLTTFTNNFFEFSERQTYEDGLQNFLLLHELEINKEYYVFITTAAGLYRYNMNDIIVVSGYINKCPLIKFIQKGKGVCNITGEKLYESQLLNALKQLQLESKFIQILANEELTRYEFYIEENGNENLNSKIIANKMDVLLSEQNIEYKEKRASGRLKAMEVFILKAGTFEIVKKIAIKKGQSEGQYKTMLLLYKKQLGYDLMQFAI